MGVENESGNNTNQEPVRVILIRHGQTDYNKNKILQGHIDIPLNEAGIRQAEHAGRRLLDEHKNQVSKVDAIFASDLMRCRQTAQYIVQTGDLHHLHMQFDDRLRERSMGQLEGKAVSEAQQLARTEGKTLLDYGEPVTQFAARLYEVWDRIVNESIAHGYHTVVVVSHGGSISTLCHHLESDMGFQVSENAKLRITHNCSFSQVLVDRATKIGIINTYGDSTHIPEELTHRVDQRAL